VGWPYDFGQVPRARRGIDGLLELVAARGLAAFVLFERVTPPFSLLSRCVQGDTASRARTPPKTHPSADFSTMHRFPSVGSQQIPAARVRVGRV
jgi:hypothetical protein